MFFNKLQLYFAVILIYLHIFLARYSRNLHLTCHLLKTEWSIIDCISLRYICNCCSILQCISQSTYNLQFYARHSRWHTDYKSIFILIHCTVRTNKTHGVFQLIVSSMAWWWLLWAETSDQKSIFKNEVLDLTVGLITINILLQFTYVTYFFYGEGPRSRYYGRTAALRLMVQPCDKD
jgi:hypothetical protein